MKDAGRHGFPDREAGLLRYAGILCGRAIARGVPNKLIKKVLRDWVARNREIWKKATGSDAFFEKYYGMNVEATTNRLWEKLAALPEEELDATAGIVNKETRIAGIVKPRRP
jgi:hypothetical protein